MEFILAYCLIASTAGLILGGMSLIKTIAMEKSTHSVQFQPIDSVISQSRETQEVEINKTPDPFNEDDIDWKSVSFGKEFAGAKKREVK